MVDFRYCVVGCYAPAISVPKGETAPLCQQSWHDIHTFWRVLAWDCRQMGHSWHAIAVVWAAESGVVSPHPYTGTVNRAPHWGSSHHDSHVTPTDMASILLRGHTRVMQRTATPTTTEGHRGAPSCHTVVFDYASRSDTRQLSPRRHVADTMAHRVHYGRACTRN